MEHRASIHHIGTHMGKARNYMGPYMVGMSNFTTMKKGYMSKNIAYISPLNSNFEILHIILAI